MKSRICSLAGILLMAAVILVFLPLTVPRLFGYQIYGILTDSMEPNYPAGCVVYVKETDSAGIRVGDVITFQMGTDTDLVMTHRVAEIDHQGGCQQVCGRHACGVRPSDRGGGISDSNAGKSFFLSVYGNRNHGLLRSVCDSSSPVGNRGEV